MTQTLTTNKVAAAAIGVAMVFSFSFAGTASAQSVEDLAAQIASLLATITSLQAQLAEMTGGTVMTGSNNFTLSHEMGDEGGEIMDIQKFLNANGFAVSATGAGSPGNETSYFGSRTKQAVVAFQNANTAAILTPVGLTSGTGYWGPSSRAHANSMGGGTTVPTGTGITVSAAAQPANGLAVESAARLPFTKFVLTNNSGTAQVINSVTVERGGLSSNGSFDGVVLLDQNGMQLGNSRVLNSVNQATIGEAVTLNPGESRTFTVAANMEANNDARAGEVATFSVVAINTSATVAGSLPITGAAHTINATLAIGSVTAARGVEDPNASATKEIGTTNYTFTAIKLTAGSAEDVRLNSVRFDQSGSAASTDLNNVVVYVDGVAYTPTMMGDYYSVFFGSGIIIKEGLTKEIVVKGDIIGGTNRTASFDIYKFTDINVTGETYGYGLTPTNGTGFGTTSPVYNSSVVTISAGTFNSVSKSSSAPAANIAIQTSNQILGAFTIDIKGEPITVQTVTMVATIAGGPVGTDLDNVTLVDQNGVVLAGPVDASGDATGDISFASVSFPTGATTVYVKGYLDSTFGNSDTITMSTTPSNWSDATGDVTGDTITLPSSTATANVMTVQAATLAAITLTQPAARSIVPGATDFVFATASLDAANSGEDVRVTAVIVEDTVSNTGEGTEIDNMEIWANLSGGATADSVRGDRFETRVADAEQLTGSGTGDHTITISLDTHIVVTKNTSVEIAIVADLSSAASGSDVHTISLDQASGAVTAVGANSGTSITITPTGAGQSITVASSGTLTLTIDSSTPSASLMLDSTSQQESAIFRLAADNVETLDVDSIKLTSDGSDDAVASYHFWVDVDGVEVEIGSVTGGQDTAEVFFSDGTLVIAADSHKLVTVKVVMNNVDGTQIVNGDTVITTIAASGDVDATGQDSGSAVDSTASSVDGNTHTMYEAVPVITFEGLANGPIDLGEQLIAQIKITNNGNEDITFQSGDTNLLSVFLKIVGGDDTNGGTETITLKDDEGTVLDTDTVISTTASSKQVDFNMSSVSATVGTTIAANSYEMFYIWFDTSDLEDNGDSVRIWMDDVDADVTFGIDGVGTFAEGAIINKGDPTGPTFSRSI